MNYVLVDNLTKVFPLERLNDFSYLKKERILRNETYCFQVAYCGGESLSHTTFEVICEGFNVSIYSVDLVPSTLPVHENDKDDHYITHEPGMFPDVLRPMAMDELLVAPAGQWRAIWVELYLTSEDHSNDCLGCHEVEIICKNEEMKTVEILTAKFDLLDLALPAQELIYTRWFHCDSICHTHKVDFASVEFFHIAKNYINMASDHGMNMILTPLFTPPLDTQIGGDRLTTQLVGVYLKEGSYTFKFDLLDRWVTMCLDAGIKYFEMSHLFTQWGARHAPKIMVYEKGELKQMFGWDTDAFSEGYKVFIDQFLKALTKYFEGKNLKDYIYFHISDEPGDDHIDNYVRAKAMMEPHIEGYKIMDALSDIKYYEDKIVRLPVPATNQIQPFIEKELDELWCYYCGAHGSGVSNTFMAMPLQRVRIIGPQWFKYHVKGFLHWSLNFYNTRFSLKTIDPYRVTDAGAQFPSGDAFVVYPEGDGCIPSTRLKVLKHAIDDLGAMELLSQHKGYDYVMSLIESGLDRPITFTEYPREASYIKGLRARINHELKKLIE